MKAVLHSEPSDPSAAKSGVQVIVTRAEGAEQRGWLPNFNPRLKTFVLHTESGAQHIPFESVKTIAFLAAEATNRPKVRFSPSARLVTVRFRDESTMQGVAENFGGPRAGVFVVPTQGSPAVERIFIPVSAIRDVVSVQRLGEILVNQKMMTPETVEAALVRQQEMREEPIGEILLRKQAIEPAQLEKGLAIQRERHGTRIGEILVEQGYISMADLERALQQQKRQRYKKLGELMIELGYTSHKMIAIALSIQYDLPFKSLSEHSLDVSLRDLLLREEALQWQVLPLRLEGELLMVAIADPEQSDFTEVLERRSGAVVEQIISTPQDIHRLIGLMYPEPS